MMDKRIYLNELYDCYEKLLTKKEQDCFLDYYQNDLSLSEIAINNNVSRSAIHKMIKVIEDKLENYELSLNIWTKSNKIKEISKLNDIDEIKKELNEL